MKIKRTIYLVLILVGAVIGGVGHWVLMEEYAMMIGIVLLMFGLYKTTQLWSSGQADESGEKGEEDHGA
ncbi:MAG TPA: hypothetical protein VKZ93_01375 [Arenibacter sp.]|nr:hypothetical protein [Arenibacter sp.]